MTPFVILSLVASAFAAPQVRKQLSVVNVMVALWWQVTIITKLPSSSPNLLPSAARWSHRRGLPQLPLL